MTTARLLPANLCLVTTLSSDQCSQFERFLLQYVHIKIKDKQMGNIKVKIKIDWQ